MPLSTFKNLLLRRQWFIEEDIREVLERLKNKDIPQLRNVLLSWKLKSTASHITIHLHTLILMRKKMIKIWKENVKLRHQKLNQQRRPCKRLHQTWTSSTTRHVTKFTMEPKSEESICMIRDLRSPFYSTNTIPNFSKQSFWKSSSCLVLVNYQMFSSSRQFLRRELWSSRSLYLKLNILVRFSFLMNWAVINIHTHSDSMIPLSRLSTSYFR